jgi:hypothetical protein
MYAKADATEEHDIVMKAYEIANEVSSRFQSVKSLIE